MSTINRVFNNQRNGNNNSLAGLITPGGNKYSSKVNNFQEIYDKVEKASSLLRSRSAGRQKSAVRKYENQLKRQKEK